MNECNAWPVQLLVVGTEALVPDWCEVSVHHIRKSHLGRCICNLDIFESAEPLMRAPSLSVFYALSLLAHLDPVAEGNKVVTREQPLPCCLEPTRPGKT